jgi:hypothetical protein
MKYTQFVLSALLIPVGISCDQKMPSSTEFVLSEGMKISAQTRSGRIDIQAGKGPHRIYSSDGWSKTSTLEPRTTRWYGSFGLYDPAPGFSQHDRLILDEGRQFFSSESDALRFMKFMSGFYGSLTYTNNGLVVAYKVTEIPGGKLLRDLTIWQFYINGEKPKALLGAVDQNIQVTGGSIPEKASPIAVPVGYGRQLADVPYDPKQLP